MYYLSFLEIPINHHDVARAKVTTLLRTFKYVGCLSGAPSDVPYTKGGLNQSRKDLQEILKRSE